MTTEFTVRSNDISASVGGAKITLDSATKASMSADLQEVITRNADLIQRKLTERGGEVPREFSIVVRKRDGKVLLTTQTGVIDLATRVNAAQLFQSIEHAIPRGMQASADGNIEAPVETDDAEPVDIRPRYPAAFGRTSPYERRAPTTYPRGRYDDFDRDDDDDYFGAPRHTPLMLQRYQQQLAEQRAQLTTTSTRYNEELYTIETQRLHAENKALDARIEHFQEKLDDVNEELQSFYLLRSPSENDTHDDETIAGLKNIGHTLLAAGKRLARSSRYEELLAEQKKLTKEISKLTKEKHDNEDLITRPRDIRLATVRSMHLEHDARRLAQENDRLRRQVEERELAYRAAMEEAAARESRTPARPAPLMRTRPMSGDMARAAPVREEPPMAPAMRAYRAETPTRGILREPVEGPRFAPGPARPQEPVYPARRPTQAPTGVPTVRFEEMLHPAAEALRPARAPEHDELARRFARLGMRDEHPVPNPRERRNIFG